MINLKQSLETEVAELTERLGEEEGGNEKLLSSKKKLEKQVEEMSQDVESAEGNIKRLEKEKGVSYLLKIICLKFNHIGLNIRRSKTIKNHFSFIKVLFCFE